MAVIVIAIKRPSTNILLPRATLYRSLSLSLSLSRLDAALVAKIFLVGTMSGRRRRRRCRRRRCRRRRLVRNGYANIFRQRLLLLLLLLLMVKHSLLSFVD